MPAETLTRRSLSEVNGTVPVPLKGSWTRRWLAILGPALMVAVGYMDPGNWATDLAGGSSYNYSLVWVLLMSNLMAILLQSLCARLGIVNRRDLAQACREEYPRAIALSLYALCEVAIVACDLAEVLGSAIALQILFGLPLAWGVLLTGLDTLLLLAFTRLGIRRLEAIVISLVATIGVAMVIEIFLARPDWGGLVRGFVPSLPGASALFISIGILGATVMPHNLYLHSALVQTRRTGSTLSEKRLSVKWNTIDSAVALNLAFLVNVALLVLAAAVFFRAGRHDVADIQDAHRLLQPLLGAAIAPIAFAVALLASGQSSTITGTLAGQIVMEGFLNLRIQPWLRRLITRLLAIVPALFVILRSGEDATGSLLVLSQVVLSLQLPFAVIPLITFVSDRRRMGALAIGPVLKALAWVIAAVIVGLNAKLLVDQVVSWIGANPGAAWAIRLAVIPVAAAAVLLLALVAAWPRLRRSEQPVAAAGIHPAAGPAPSLAALRALVPYRNIAVAVDFSGGEHRLLAEALRLADRRRGRVTLLHVVESPVARVAGDEAADLETQSDTQRLAELSALVESHGVSSEWRVGAGRPAEELARLVREVEAELVIVGGHGHSGLADLARGTVVDALRHRISASLLVVPPAGSG